MLSAQAYSFRLKSRLAISLSWIGGFTNVVAVIACDQVVSHQTGNVTHLGLGVGRLLGGESAALFDVIFFGFIILAFWLGAVASAFMTEGARRAGWNSKYILPMGVECLMLCILMVLLTKHPNTHLIGWQTLSAITSVAAFAMGLQNATITKISGAIVRTTHLTGVITDLGLEGVQLLLWWQDKFKFARAGRYWRMLKLSSRHPSALRVLLLFSIFGSYLLGTTLGAISFIKFGPHALFAPVLFLPFIIGVDFLTPIADVRQIDPTRDIDMQSIKSMLPDDVGLFRLAHHHAGRHHAAPDFAGWIERLPSRWRVVILVISPLTRFDTDSASSLLGAMKKLTEQNRTLVVSGMSRGQFKVLMNCGLTEVIDLDNFVPDVEFAVARAINLAAAAAA